MRFTTGLLSAVVLWALSVVTVHAQKRVALVVGIDRYVNLSAGHQLTTAGYDARLIGDALSRVGFDVIRAQDVGRAAFVAKLRELQRKLTPGDFVFFYFAGHGVSFGGANYILPSDVPDVRAGQEARLASAALGEDDIVADLKRRRIKAAIMILDASRPVPFSQANALRGINAGHTPPRPENEVSRLYSAGIGQFSLDGARGGGPGFLGRQGSLFATVLGSSLVTHRDFSTAAAYVIGEVARRARSAGYDQRPDYYEGSQEVARSLMLAVASRSPAPRVSTPPDSDPLRMPDFPWPPPAPSALYVMPRELLVGPGDVGEPELRDLMSRLERALEQAGYYERSYYAVPGGIAMVTRMERILRDGTPDAARRWLDVEADTTFTLSRYLKGLLFDDRGLYRLIVFVISPTPFSATGPQLGLNEAKSILPRGFNTIPPSNRDVKFTLAHSCSVLIYEFSKEKEREPHLVPQSALPARIHLEKANVWSAIESASKR
jgi:caspase domain-containing protein